MINSYNCSFFFFGLDNIRAFIFFSIYLLVMTTIIFLSIYKKTKLGYLAYFLVILGGSANLYQRATSGCVMDNISFFGLFMFNVFDLMIVLGSIILVGILAKNKIK